ncbi:DUF2750 domain-containing protein [Paenibacillus timonensis]|uniref:DUF2750 domain-containing protein n=1 Tax=Paenibacillus timonensis TaxID=225915 RepID=UPI003F94A470
MTTRSLWGLYDDGWALSTDDVGNHLFPFWPRKEFAEYCAIGDWSNYKAESIELYDFIEEFLPEMKKDKIRPSVFYNNIDSAVLEIDAISVDIERELEKY